MYAQNVMSETSIAGNDAFSNNIIEKEKKMRTIRTLICYLLAALFLLSCSKNTHHPTRYHQNRVSAEELNRLISKAGNGDKDAQFKLGDIYINGNGVPINYGEALRWYKKAALQGHADAQYSVGLMYDKGHIGIPKNNETAYVWYKLSSEQGQEDAKRNFISVENLMTTSEIERAEKEVLKLRYKIN